MSTKYPTKTKRKTPTASHIGSNGKPQHYVGTWLDDDDYLKLGLDAIENHRSIAGEVRSRIIETTTTLKK